MKLVLRNRKGGHTTYPDRTGLAVAGRWVELVGATAKLPPRQGWEGSGARGGAVHPGQTGRLHGSGRLCSWLSKAWPACLAQIAQFLPRPRHPISCSRRSRRPAEPATSGWEGPRGRSRCRPSLVAPSPGQACSLRTCRGRPDRPRLQCPPGAERLAAGIVSAAAFTWADVSRGRANRPERGNPFPGGGPAGLSARSGLGQGRALDYRDILLPQGFAVEIQAAGEPGVAERSFASPIRDGRG